MNKLPDEKTLNELVELGKSFEDQARKLYEMTEAFAQKWEHRLGYRPQEKQEAGKTE